MHNRNFGQFSRRFATQPIFQSQFQALKRLATFNRRSATLNALA
jgi:hypothetical protein